MKKKALALALVLCMVIAMLPVSIFAAPLKQTAQIQPQDRIEEESLLTIEPQALPELPAEPNDGKYKINAKITKGSSHGEIELSATSANAREKVYLMANPDDGYLVKLGGSYEYYYHQMEVIYVGMDIYEITMPDGKVDLEIQFVAASGSNHNVHITVNDPAFGSVVTTRTSAKENESVYLTVTPSAGYYLESLTAKDANGSDALGLYLGEEEGSGYFEVLMPTTDLYIEVNFQKMVPHRITIDTFFEDGVDGTAHVDKDYLMAGEQFYLYIDLVPSMKVSVIDTRSDEGYIPVTWVSSGKWTGIMPNCDLHIMISIERDMRTFNVEVSGTAHGQYYNNHQVQVGKTVGVRFYPDEGYRGIILDDDGVEDLVWAERDYVTFTMPKRDVNMVIAFVERYKPITLTVGKHGTATVSHTQSEEGEAVTITCVPEEGYKVDRITGVEGLVDNGDGTYTFLMPYRAVDLTVTFKNIYNPVNLTVETGLGGTASVSHEKAEEGDVVTVVCTPEEGYRIARIAGVKDLTDNGDGTYTFTMPDEAVELKVLFLRHENPFLDVNETHFFYDPVLWAVEENITAGLTADTFGPFAVCNRAQVVTFLWRAAGCPEPSGEENPFSDVKAADFFYKPVLWAVENGITAGISATEFGPGLACNRAQVVTFLFRARNAQLPEGAVNPFEDVKETDFFYAPVLWALENGVTAGSDATHFSPVGQCQRAQVVTFLYRAKDLPVNTIGELTIETAVDTVVYIGETLQIKYTYTGDKSALTFKSDDTSILTVNNSGLVKGVSAGKTRVKVYHGDTMVGRIRLVVEEKVAETEPPEMPKAERISASEFTGPYFDGTAGVVGNYMTFRATAKTSGDNQAVTATSSNSGVVSVERTSVTGSNSCLFKVKFKGAGTATITITSEDGNASKSYTITVKGSYSSAKSGQLTPEEFVSCVNGIMTENGANISTSMGYRVLTLSEDELTGSKARSKAEGWVREFWPNGIRSMGLAYQGVNEDGNHVFYIHR